MPLNEQDRDNLVAFLDGELEEGEAQALEAKINLDPQARAEVEALRKTWGMLDYLPKAQPSETFTNRTMERLALSKSGLRTGPQRRTGRLSWAGRLGWAAAVLAAAGLGMGGARLVFKKSPDFDEALIRHLRVLEKWKHYENVDDLDLLRDLDKPDLFGDDPGL